MIKETITIETTEDGQPYFEPNHLAQLAVYFSESESNEESTQIEICGSAAGLRRLGEILIAVANCKSYHVHLDASDISPILIRGDRVELTISNDDSAPPSEPNSDRFVPDWARG